MPSYRSGAGQVAHGDPPMTAGRASRLTARERSHDRTDRIPRRWSPRRHLGDGTGLCAKLPRWSRDPNRTPPADDDGCRLDRYEAVIGIEVHCQLRTASKMFCGCSHGRTTGRRRTRHVCPVCLGLPGALPVDQPAGGGARPRDRPRDRGDASPAATRWDRKNYFYPDLPKGYQISQYDLPLASRRPAGLRHARRAVHGRGSPRAHLEEDTAQARPRRRRRGRRGQPGGLQPLRAFR